jgi:hypothetical protein
MLADGKVEGDVMGDRAGEGGATINYTYTL